MCPGYERSPRRSHHRRAESSLGLWPDVPFSALHDEEDGGGGGGGDEDRDLGSLEQQGQPSKINADDDEQEEEEEEEEHCGDESDEDEMERLARRRGRCSSTYYMDRQMYLHSYRFSRKLSLQDRLKASLRRFRAAALAIVACNHIKAKPLARKFKDKIRRCCGGVGASLGIGGGGGVQRRKPGPLFCAIPVRV